MRVVRRRGMCWSVVCHGLCVRECVEGARVLRALCLGSFMSWRLYMSAVVCARECYAWEIIIR